MKKNGGLGKAFDVTAPQKGQGCYSFASLEDQSEILEFNRTTPCVSRTLLMVTEQVTVHGQGRKQCSNLWQGSWKVQCSSDNEEEFSAAAVKPSAKATQAALAKDLFAGVSSVCTKENYRTRL